MNGRTNRNRGFGFEREIVKAFEERGIGAERCWGSDGRSRGLPKDVDIVAGERYYQAKRKKTLASYLRAEPHLEGVIFREDRSDSRILIPLSRYLELLALEQGAP